MVLVKIEIILALLNPIRIKKVVKSRCPTDKDFKALTEREGLTEEDWPDVVAIQTSLYSDRAKTTEGKYFPARL